jgi:hypothetical protein
MVIKAIFILLWLNSGDRMIGKVTVSFAEIIQNCVCFLGSFIVEICIVIYFFLGGRWRKLE